MARNAYYISSHWLNLRSAALKRDARRCAVAGCYEIATHVDHIETRPNSDTPTRLDVLSNLRCFCSSHDAQIKEKPDGTRRRGGKPVVKGCDASGWPTDPAHPWAKTSSNLNPKRELR